MLELLEISWERAMAHLGQLLVAYALALPLGWDQEKHARSAGLRTFPLVAVAACGYMIVGLYVLPEGDARARVMYGIITGIGFIGGGAILKESGSVRGTATAASIWNTGAIGIAVAWNRFEIAVSLAVVNFLTLRLVSPLKQRVERGKDHEAREKKDEED